jgi:hypothetical protein
MDTEMYSANDSGISVLDWNDSNIWINSVSLIIFTCTMLIIDSMNTFASLHIFFFVNPKYPNLPKLSLQNYFNFENLSFFVHPFKASYSNWYVSASNIPYATVSFRNPYPLPFLVLEYNHGFHLYYTTHLNNNWEAILILFSPGIWPWVASFLKSIKVTGRWISSAT